MAIHSIYIGGGGYKEDEDEEEEQMPMLEYMENIHVGND